MAVLRRLTRILRAAPSRGVFALLALAPGVALSQSNEAYREDAVKAAFLYRFTGYVDWPPSALNAKVFTIAVLDARDVARELDRILPAHRVKGLPARARQISSWRDVGDAQVLYVGAGFRGDLRQLAQKLAGRAVLIVTDDAHGLDAGGVVNFLLVDRRVRFEVSVSAAERAGLKIGSELLSVATRVRGAAALWEMQCRPARGRRARECSIRTAQL